MHHRFLRQVGGVARRLVLHLRVVLHTSPETAVGGPLALVKDGDMIELDVDKRRLQLDVADAELAKRRQAWKPPQSDYDRGSSSARAARRWQGSLIEGSRAMRFWQWLFLALSP